MAILARMRRAQGKCLIEVTPENLSWLYKCSRSCFGKTMVPPLAIQMQQELFGGKNWIPPCFGKTLVSPPPGRLLTPPSPPNIAWAGLTNTQSSRREDVHESSSSSSSSESGASDEGLGEPAVDLDPCVKLRRIKGKDRLRGTATDSSGRLKTVTCALPAVGKAPIEKQEITKMCSRKVTSTLDKWVVKHDVDTTS